ncbi:MAG TPA: LLM class F420-dependent oxidoreductase [Ktedonobacterales bacterium]
MNETQRAKLTFGVKTAPQNTTYDDMLRVWREADEQPKLTHAWLFDHFMPLGADPTGPCLEGWTLLAAFAAQTHRIRVGQMVTGNTYRHPTVLANMGATVDIISHGRMDFGIGAGWNELEHASYGIPLPAPGDRIRMLGEACEIIRRMWTEEAPTFEGRYYQVQNARCEPKPVQKPLPPFVIGGSGEKLTLRVVAQYADVWNFSGGSVEEFARKSAILDEHCAAIGRNPAAIARSIQFVVNYADIAATRETVREYIAAGANHVILNLRAPYPEGIARRLATEVAAPLLAEMA